jgi:hypothetical protein
VESLIIYHPSRGPAIPKKIESPSLPQSEQPEAPSASRESKASNCFHNLSAATNIKPTCRILYGIAAVDGHSSRPIAERAPSLRLSSANVGKGANPPNVDFLFALARLGDIVRRLHPHERVHPYTECFFDAESHVPGKVCLAVQQAGEGRAGHLKRGGGCRYR